MNLFEIVGIFFIMIFSLYLVRNLINRITVYPFVKRNKKKKIQKNVEELRGLSQKFYTGFAEKEDIERWYMALGDMQTEIIRAQVYITDPNFNSTLGLESFQESYRYYKAVYCDYLAIYHPNHNELRDIGNLLKYKNEMFKKIAYILLYESITFLEQSERKSAEDLIVEISNIIDIENSNRFMVVTMFNSEAFTVYNLINILREVRKYSPSIGFEEWHERLAFCLPGLSGDF
ncbi:hypothetical protein M3Y14_32480 (plasmid) [Bacillus thuringiensis]|uniref:hypothetical protein n=1 Tax=Bacillus thuringiensis TaxID=1428 RepID=UPI0022241CB8|nr:hypothetical protein [Bacillus thuringiensis]UYX55959.1 hypothetical protein M3Y14_32480 [Bacillus thuringiensis]